MMGRGCSRTTPPSSISPSPPPLAFDDLRLCPGNASILVRRASSPRVYKGQWWKAAILFVLGFWLLDFSNNAVQGPASAMMADLSGQHGCNKANAIFCSWMAVGNILGYLSGSSGNWHKWFPFLETKACCEACANLKGAFFVAVLFLLICMIVTLIVAKEVPLGDEIVQPEDVQGPFAIFTNLVTALKSLPPGMMSVFLVTSLTWLSWFPFILYDTDWMGREIYHGDPKGTPAQMDAYERGVRQGALALLLNSIVLGITSLLIEPMCRIISAKLVWATSSFMMCIGMAATVLISAWSSKEFHSTVQEAITTDNRVVAAAMILFVVLGVPLAILFSIPFAYVAQLAFNEGGGQGLCTGILNISIVIPQVIVALGAGPWDAIFKKGGNISAFALASALALLCGIVAIFRLPNLSRRSF